MTASELLASLTPEQREAAEYIGGPLRIIAGAGTGKTTTITARFVNLVHTHSVAPHEILAVTFSSKAATEMRQRIIKNLGLAHRRLWIQTFHSLCLRLLGEWQRQAGEPDPRVLSELERVRYLQTAVDSVPLNARRFYHGSHGTRVFVRDLATYADRFADDLRPDLTDLSAVPPRHVDLERARLAYRDLITSDGVFDFASLGTETIRRLESDPALRTRTRALFRHMLVDEFQDTNHAQFRLIELLVPNGNQICVVGDENQAIYAFRGGRSEYFETFAARFPRTKTCRLRQNYRSGDEILHAANSLIGHNGVASGGAAQLALVATGDRHAIVTATESDSPELEAESVARRIIAITADSDSTIGFDDVAVLFRSVRTSVEPFRRAFNLYSIPFTLGPIVGLDYAIRQDIAAALRLALGPAQWTDAARLALRSGSNALDRQALERHFNSGHLAALLSTDPGSWPEMPMVEQRFLEQARDIVLAATAIDRSSPAMLCYMAIRLAGHLHEGIDPVQARQLTQLVNTAATLPNAQSVRDFVAAGKSDEDIPPDDPAGVSLLTIHAAKGLEWPVVFVAGLTEGTFPLPVRASHEADILAVSREQTETTSVTSAAEAELSHLREERRLAYVAVTRAKTQLHLSWSCTTGDEPAPISRFVGELAVLTGPRTPYDDEYERLTSMYALGRQLRIRQAVARTTDPAGEAGSLALGDLLVAQWASRHVPGVLPIRNRTTPTPYDDNASISFSPTSIKTYDDCPRRYLYSALLHLGSEEQGAAQTLGNAVHAALEELTVPDWKPVRFRATIVPSRPLIGFGQKPDSK